MLINGKILFRCVNIHKGEVSSEWRAYDINKRSHSIMVNTQSYEPTKRFVFADSVALNDNIYSFAANGYVLVTNMSSFQQSIIKVLGYQGEKFNIHRKFAYTIKNNIYSTEFSFNTKSHRIEPIQSYFKGIKNILQDSKTGRWYGYKTKKNKNYVYCYSGNMIKYGGFYIFERDGGKRKVKNELIDLKSTKYWLAYNDYLMYSITAKDVHYGFCEW